MSVRNVILNCGPILVDLWLCLLRGWRRKNYSTNRQRQDRLTKIQQYERQANRQKVKQIGKQTTIRQIDKERVVRQRYKQRKVKIDQLDKTKVRKIDKEKEIRDREKVSQIRLTNRKKARQMYKQRMIETFRFAEQDFFQTLQTEKSVRTRSNTFESECVTSERSSILFSIIHRFVGRRRC